MKIGYHMAHVTVRISASFESGGGSIGSGFLYSEPYANVEGHSVNLLITNRHVVEDTSEGRIFFHLADTSGEQIIVGGKSRYALLKDWQSRWFFHPRDEIDLACMPIGDIAVRLGGEGEKLFQVPFTAEHLPTVERFEQFDVVEDVYMVGYPIGLWDEVNNLPLIRRGVTATHPAINFNGREEFVIDLACFPGSSGSPVVRLNDGQEEPEGGLLLGVLYSGPQHSVTVENESDDENSNPKMVQIPSHLGYVIRSTAVRELIDSVVAAAVDPEDPKFNLDLHQG